MGVCGVEEGCLCESSNYEVFVGTEVVPALFYVGFGAYTNMLADKL